MLIEMPFAIFVVYIFQSTKIPLGCVMKKIFSKDERLLLRRDVLTKKTIQVRH
jgi:hypothetical protein